MCHIHREQQITQQILETNRKINEKCLGLKKNKEERLVKSNQIELLIRMK